MAAPSTVAARIVTATDTLYTKLAHISALRSILVLLGGVNFIAPALDPEGEGEDPAPDLSSAQMAQAFNAVQNLETVLSANADAHRKALLETFVDPAEGVRRARSAMREARAQIATLIALRQECVDQGGQTWLEGELDAEQVSKVVACLAAVLALQVQLDANSGTDRKALTRASN